MYSGSEDNTTVVGGTLSAIGDSSYLIQDDVRKGTDSKKTITSKGVVAQGPSEVCFETTEYMDIERPFVVTIGKDGLISALQRLDQQLRDVSVFRKSLKKVKFCRSYEYSISVRQSVHIIAQGKRVHFYHRVLHKRYKISILLQSPTDWIGKEITPGQLGLINHGGLPKILIRPGRYPGFPLRNWWARNWCGTKGCKTYSR